VGIPALALGAAFLDAFEDKFGVGVDGFAVDLASFDGEALAGDDRGLQRERFL
jgi:hypothetical protein